MEELKKGEEPQQAKEIVSDDVRQSIIDQHRTVEPAKLNISNRGNFAMISIVPDDDKQRIDNDIICVIDVSGSMQEEAAVKNDQGVKEVFGLSKLDVLKHAVRTTIFSLGDQDRFGLVSFSDTAKVEYPLKNMTNDEQKNVSNILDQLIPDGQTNLWAGLKQGMDILRGGFKSKNRHSSIILLTDGEPNVPPPSGHQNQLQKYLQKFPNFYFSLQTFAFGKNTDSVLLKELAEIGHGDYSFIPCPGFIGTIFVNTLSNLMSTIGVTAQLKIETLNNAKIQSPENPEQVVSELNIQVGDIKFGQSRDFAFQLGNLPQDQNLPVLKVHLKYFDYCSQKFQELIVNEHKLNQQEDPMVSAHYCRHLTKKKVFEAMKVRQEANNLPGAQDIIKQLSVQVHEIYDGLQGGDAKRLEESKEYLNRILLDIDGEIRLSFLKDEWFQQWGRHYLPSLMNAHTKQICNNFKDPGIQKYGGKVFNDVKDNSEEIFINLPPPKSSQQQQAQKLQQQLLQQNLIDPQDIQQNANQVQQNQNQQQQQPAMQVYYDAGGGGCFHGDCDVELIGEGKEKKIKDLCKGDLLRNGACVVALIQIKCDNRKVQLVQFEGGLLITPNHPIRVNDQWCKPFTLKQPIEHQCEYVYNVVLDKEHYMRVNGIECVTLGHGLKGQFVEHPYFGSQMIINDLKKSKQWNSGFIQIDNEQFVRSLPNNRIVGINYIY